MGSSGCSAGAVPSKQTRISKRLVLGAVLCGCGGGGAVQSAGLYKQRFGLVWCGCKGVGLSQSKIKVLGSCVRR